ncbi:MAG: SDR family oxidoreductase [Lentisphaeria bacterium]|nr:SDR family oxidoreductase [Lentisphaeria bacterium]
MSNYLITGISDGIGLAYLKTILRRSPDAVFYGISRHVSPGLSELIAEFSGRLHYFPCDLSVPFPSLEEELKSFLPIDLVLDGFFDNAGIYRPFLISQLNEERIMETMNVNLISPIMLTKIVLKNFLRHKTKGSIVHVSSIAAHIGFNATSVYSAAKGGLEAFSRNVAQEWGSRQIRSNVVTLGLLDIGMSRVVPPSLQQELKERSLLKRTTDIDTIIDTVEFLLSDRSASITGENIHINAGVYMA